MRTSRSESGETLQGRYSVSIKSKKMNDMEDHKILDFGDNEKNNSIIKVIGVGGGGGNAVNHMYREGIHAVSYTHLTLPTN